MCITMFNLYSVSNEIYKYTDSKSPFEGLLEKILNGIDPNGNILKDFNDTFKTSKS